MERKGECCLAPRYGQAGQAWQMGRIMLKFRPIAPKPAAMAQPAPVPSPVTAAGAAKRKRKAVPGGSGRRGRKPKKAATVAAVMAAPAALKMGDHKDKEKDKSVSPTTSSSGMTSVDSSPPPPPPATLPLMPVLSVEKEQVAAAADLGLISHGVGQIMAPQALRPAAVTWVTVEAVTGIWRDEEAPSAEACGVVDDEAPSFVSDQWGRVTWTNTAFNRAASAGAADVEDDASAPESARVVLAAKDAATVPAWGTCAGFACRVRVRHACPRRSPLVAPCDVWRLDAGCYLWRLDLQATLTLSLGGGLL